MQSIFNIVAVLCHSDCMHCYADWNNLYAVYLSLWLKSKMSSLWLSLNWMLDLYDSAALCYYDTILSNPEEVEVREISYYLHYCFDVIVAALLRFHIVRDCIGWYIDTVSIDDGLDVDVVVVPFQCVPNQSVYRLSPPHLNRCCFVLSWTVTRWKHCDLSLSCWCCIA